MGVPQYSYMGVRWHPCMGAQVALLALPPHSRRGCKELFVILGFIYILLFFSSAILIIHHRLIQRVARVAIDGAAGADAATKIYCALSNVLPV